MQFSSFRKCLGIHNLMPQPTSIASPDQGILSLALAACRPSPCFWSDARESGAEYRKTVVEPAQPRLLAAAPDSFPLRFQTASVGQATDRFRPKPFLARAWAVGLLFSPI